MQWPRKSFKHQYRQSNIQENFGFRRAWRQPRTRKKPSVAQIYRVCHQFSTRSRLFPQPTMALDDGQRDILSKHINRLLSTREFPKTICPSEVARALSSAELEALQAHDWRATMDDVRELVWEMREVGEVEVMQKGQVLDVQSLVDVKGPIRVRKVQAQ
jgi:hypothetical protein